MKQLEIKEKIDCNNRIIQEILSLNQFTLNNTVANLLAENLKLQEECNHEFEDGYCVYCYKEE